MLISTKAMNWSLAPYILVADADAMPSSSAEVFKQETQKAVEFNSTIVKLIILI